METFPHKISVVVFLTTSMYVPDRMSRARYQSRDIADVSNGPRDTVDVSNKPSRSRHRCLDAARLREIRRNKGSIDGMRKKYNFGLHALLLHFSRISLWLFFYSSCSNPGKAHQQPRPKTDPSPIEEAEAPVGGHLSTRRQGQSASTPATAASTVVGIPSPTTTPISFHVNVDSLHSRRSTPNVVVHH
nr:hypothetical protein Itr_chr12CG16980 [Ipomoea trifida]